MVLRAHRVTLFACLLLPFQMAMADPLAVFSPPEGQYSVYMEGQPQSKSMNTGMGIARCYAHDEKAGGYWITSTNVPWGSKSAADVVNRSLNGACNGAVAGIKGKETSRYTVNLPGGYPGRQIEGSLPNGQGYFRMRMYLVDKQLYQMVVAGSKAYINGKTPNTFLNSLSITPKETAVARPQHSSNLSSNTSTNTKYVSPEDLRKKEERQYKSIMLHENVKHSLEHAHAGKHWGQN